MSGVAGQNGRRGVQGDQGAKGVTGSRGITGKQGDSGDQGSKGAAGERGQSGDRGVAGERGPKGDHGQDGKRGMTGEDGVSSPYLGRGQTIALFLFVVLAFVLLAWRSEVNAHELKRAQQRQAATDAKFRSAFLTLCQKQRRAEDQATAFRVEAHNRFLIFADQERVNPFIHGAFRTERVGNWVALAEGAQLAADAGAKADCELFR